MKLIESKIGGKVYVKSLNRFLEVSPENISLLSKLGLTEYFEKDADNNKPTYVSILGVKQARELAEQLRLDAYQALEIFGTDAARLRQLTDYIIQREF